MTASTTGTISTNQYDENQAERRSRTESDQSCREDVEVAMPEASPSSKELKIEDQQSSTNQKRNRKYKLIICSLCLVFIGAVLLSVLMPTLYRKNHSAEQSNAMNTDTSHSNENASPDYPTDTNTTSSNSQGSQNSTAPDNASNSSKNATDANTTTIDNTITVPVPVPVPLPVPVPVPVPETGAPTASPVSQAIPLNTPAALGVWNVLTTQSSNSSELQNDPSSLQYQVFKWMLNATSDTNSTGSLSNGSLVAEIVGNDATGIASDPKRSTKILQRYTLAYLYAKMHGYEGYSPSSSNGSATGGRSLTSQESVVQLALPSAYSLVDECSWPGVTCANWTLNNQTGEQIMVVDKVVWAQEGLKGEIPPEILDLKNLTYLDLGENSLSGPIPDFLYDMVKLKELYLHSNQLTGSISTKIGQLANLEKIFLFSNYLTGTIPMEFGSVTSTYGTPRPLQYISLFNNSLEGPLPARINWTQVIYLDLGHNKFSGTIPDIWVKGQGSFSKLRYFYIDHNKLGGDLPYYWPNLGQDRAELIDISNNNFTGAYSFAESYSQTEFLAVLEIQNNSFSYISNDICQLSVFQGGELVRINADCGACTCQTLCDTCNSNPNHSNNNQGGTTQGGQGSTTTNQATTDDQVGNDDQVNSPGQGGNPNQGGNNGGGPGNQGGPGGGPGGMWWSG